MVNGSKITKRRTHMAVSIDSSERSKTEYGMVTVELALGIVAFAIAVSCVVGLLGNISVWLKVQNTAIAAAHSLVLDDNCQKAQKIVYETIGNQSHLEFVKHGQISYLDIAYPLPWVWLGKVKVSVPINRVCNFQ